MEMEGLREFLMFALPGGFLGSVFAWLAGRRKRNNDMLSQLQSSINMLCGENRKILDENVQLRVENAQLRANQEEMIQKLALLTKEVERLRKVINKKTNEKNVIKADSSAGGTVHERVFGTEDCNARTGNRRGGKHGTEKRHYGQSGLGEGVTDDGGDSGAQESENRDAVGCSGFGDIADADDGEPP